MGLCQVALIAAFLVLLQCELHHAAGCSNRKTVIIVKVSGKTNINVKYSPKSDPVKFVPYPYNDGNNNSDCFICNGPRCQKCTKTENQSPSLTTSQGQDPVQTNIIIDLRQKKSASQNKPKNKDTKNKTTSLTGTNNQSTGGTTTQDGTFVLVQDLTSASSASKSISSESSKNGGQTSASSVASAATSDSDIIAAFDQISPGSESKSSSNIEDIMILNNSTSSAAGSGKSNASTFSKSVPNNKTPESESTVSFSKVITKTGNSGESSLANSEGAAKKYSVNTSSDGSKTTSLAGATSAAESFVNGGDGSEFADDDYFD